jgi:hypothetical protein
MTRETIAAAAALLLLHAVVHVVADQRIVSSAIVSCLPPAPPPAAAAAAASPGRRNVLQVLPTQAQDEVVVAIPRPTELKCYQKLSLLVELAPEASSAETLELRCIGSPVCPCPCNYISDPGCGCRDLKTVLKIKLTHQAFTGVFETVPYGTNIYSWGVEEVVTSVTSCPVSSSAGLACNEQCQCNMRFWLLQHVRLVL